MRLLYATIETSSWNERSLKIPSKEGEGNCRCFESNILNIYIYISFHHREQNLGTLSRFLANATRPSKPWKTFQAARRTNKAVYGIEPWPACTHTHSNMFLNVVKSIRARGAERERERLTYARSWQDAAVNLAADTCKRGFKVSKGV